MVVCNYFNLLEVEKFVVFVLVFFIVEKIFVLLKLLRFVVFLFVRVVFIYSILYSFEFDVYSMNGEIFIVDMFDGWVFGCYMS